MNSEAAYILFFVQISHAGIFFQSNLLHNFSVWKVNVRIFFWYACFAFFFSRSFPPFFMQLFTKKLIEKGTVKLIVNISVLVTKVHVNFVQSDHLKVFIKCINLVHIASFL